MSVDRSASRIAVINKVLEEFPIGTRVRWGRRKKARNIKPEGVLVGALWSEGPHAAHAGRLELIIDWTSLTGVKHRGTHIEYNNYLFGIYKHFIEERYGPDSIPLGTNVGRDLQLLESKPCLNGMPHERWISFGDAVPSAVRRLREPILSSWLGRTLMPPSIPNVAGTDKKPSPIFMGTFGKTSLSFKFPPPPPSNVKDDPPTPKLSSLPPPPPPSPVAPTNWWSEDPKLMLPIGQYDGERLMSPLNLDDDALMLDDLLVMHDKDNLMMYPPSELMDNFLDDIGGFEF